METTPKTLPAKTTEPTTAPSSSATPKRPASKSAAKRPASKPLSAAKIATAKRTNAKSAAKAKATTGAKSAAKATTGAKAKATTRATGPTPERARLAIEVAKLRKNGVKWNEIAAKTGKSEPTLATLRKDVRAGKFAKLSPVALRTAANAF